MRDTTIIYRSFYEAIKTLSKEDQANVWEAVFEYSLNMKEIELQGVANTIFLLMKPNLEANIKRYNNGKKAKHKQKVSKTEARGKQEVSKDEANKDKDKDKDNNDNKEIYISYLSHLNLCTNKKYRGSPKAKAAFFARLKDGYTFEEITKAISNASNDPFHRENKYDYLTPEFFTRADKLDKFLNNGTHNLKPVQRDDSW